MNAADVLNAARAAGLCLALMAMSSFWSRPARRHLPFSISYEPTSPRLSRQSPRPKSPAPQAQTTSPIGVTGTKSGPRSGNSTAAILVTRLSVWHGVRLRTDGTGHVVTGSRAIYVPDAADLLAQQKRST
jgi:hypothetical protein